MTPDGWRIGEPWFTNRLIAPSLERPWNCYGYRGNLTVHCTGLTPDDARARLLARIEHIETHGLP